MSEDLPDFLGEIEKVVGREAALTLALALGGQHIYVPKPGTLHPSHPLVEAIGAASAEALAAIYQGDSIYIPMARRALARDMNGRGLSPREIAAALRISVHTARRYRRSC